MSPTFKITKQLRSASRRGMLYPIHTWLTVLRVQQGLEGYIIASSAIFFPLFILVAWTLLWRQSRCTVQNNVQCSVAQLLYTTLCPRENLPNPSTRLRCRRACRPCHHQIPPTKAFSPTPHACQHYTAFPPCLVVPHRPRHLRQIKSVPHPPLRLTTSARCCRPPQ